MDGIIVLLLLVVGLFGLSVLFDAMFYQEKHQP